MNVKKGKVQCLEKEIQEKNSIINELEVDHENLNKTLETALKDGLRHRKKISFLKSKLRNSNSSSNDSFSQSYITELKEKIKILENEKLELEEKINDFTNSSSIQLFHNGKYNNNIRAVYEDLLCMGCSTRNIEQIITIVLKI